MYIRIKICGYINVHIHKCHAHLISMSFLGCHTVYYKWICLKQKCILSHCKAPNFMIKMLLETHYLESERNKLYLSFLAVLLKPSILLD